jgi:hypothetical protein
MSNQQELRQAFLDFQMGQFGHMEEKEYEPDP